MYKGAQGGWTAVLNDVSGQGRSIDTSGGPDEKPDSTEEVTSGNSRTKGLPHSPVSIKKRCPRPERRESKAPIHVQIPAREE